jgi:hypothetical protein
LEPLFPMREDSRPTFINEGTKLLFNGNHEDQNVVEGSGNFEDDHPKTKLLVEQLRERFYLS